jgi:hypothetical protein
MAEPPQVLFFLTKSGHNGLELCQLIEFITRMKNLFISCRNNRISAERSLTPILGSSWVAHNVRRFSRCWQFFEAPISIPLDAALKALQTERKTFLVSFEL